MVHKINELEMADLVTTFYEKNPIAFERDHAIYIQFLKDSDLYDAYYMPDIDRIGVTFADSIWSVSGSEDVEGFLRKKLSPEVVEILDKTITSFDDWV